MFITDKLVYIQLQKTGCSHIARLLEQTVGGRQVGRHNPAGRVLLDTSRLFVASIRNPWEWYVSLWSYGCDGKGGFYKTVTSRGARVLSQSGNPVHMARLLYHQMIKNTGLWKRCYADSTNPTLFREWLGMVLDPVFRFDMAENYGGSPVHDLVGIYTYRFLSLCCRNPRALRKNRFESMRDLERFEKENCYIDKWIRNESLERDFVEIVSSAGENLTGDDEKIIFSGRKMNVSSRSRPTEYFYDEASADLVREKEALIVKKFGYAL